MKKRPNIPTEIKRTILLESGYRCAIPTCRFPITENAHIISWAKAKEHKYENLIALCPNCHTLYDSGKIDRKALVAYKKKLMFLNDIYSRFEIDVLDYLKNHKRAIVPGQLLIKRLLDEKLVETEDVIHGFGDDEDMLGIFAVRLTEKGKELIDNWAKVNDSLTFENYNLSVRWWL